jgi:SAM-dependent methyltransferase
MASGGALGAPDARRQAPAAARNRAPLREALGPLLADRTGLVLEIGSGSGEHALDWAQRFPALDWQPSEPDPENRDSIDAWRATADLPNLRAALALDAAGDWAEAGLAPGTLAAVLCLNVIHIAPWRVACGIIAGAARHLAPGGLLILYGPFREGGRHTAESNAAFDDSLRARDPAWGVRDLEAVTQLADAAGFHPPRITRMPANNLVVSFASR